MCNRCKVHNAEASETGFFSRSKSVLKDLLQRSGFDHVILSPETGGEQAMFFCHQKPEANKHEEV